MDQKIAHDLKEKDRTEDIQIRENVDFSAMLLSENVLKGLKKCGYQQPSPIQLKAIPLGRCGFDLIVKAKSGTGKTAVFVITALEMIDLSKNHAQVVILAPTREIAVQIQQVIKHIGCEFQGLGVEYFIGGTPLSDDETKVQNCHIIVGAPGRVKHLIEKKLLDVSQVRLFVLDEADKLMETSFQQSINWIYNQLPKRKQVMAISATYPEDLNTFLANYMLSPTEVSPDTKMPILLGIRQFYTVVKFHLNAIQQMKFKTDELTKILSNLSFNQCLVFSNYQTRAESLSNNLIQKGWPSRFISGQQNQAKRLQAVDDLKKFKCRILSSTDLTARGIDAANVDLVVNYDVPIDVETYLHRMGRAGRYGSYGICITIASEGKELNNLQKIIKQLGNNVAIAKLPDTKFFKDIWHCDLDNLEHLHCSDDEDTYETDTDKIHKKINDNGSVCSQEFTVDTLNQVSNLVCSDYSSKFCESDVNNISDILKSVKSQKYDDENYEHNLTSNNEILKKLSTGDFKQPKSSSFEDNYQNRQLANENSSQIYQNSSFLHSASNSEELCNIDLRTENKRSKSKSTTEKSLSSSNQGKVKIDNFVDKSKRSKIDDDDKCAQVKKNLNQSTKLNPNNVYSPQKSNLVEKSFQKHLFPRSTIEISDQRRSKSEQMDIDSDGSVYRKNIITNTNISDRHLFTPFNSRLDEETCEKKVIKMSKVEEMTTCHNLQEKITNDNQTTNSNLNTILQKNIALFKITKLVMENKFCESFIKECAKEVSKLLETIYDEDELQFKNYSDGEIEQFVQRNLLRSEPFPMEQCQKEFKNKCQCPDNLFSLVYDHVLKSDNVNINFQNLFCTIHKFDNETDKSDDKHLKEEFNCDNFCAESNSMMDFEQDSNICIEENLFSKAYDGAIEGRVQNYDSNPNQQSSQNFSFSISDCSKRFVNFANSKLIDKSFQSVKSSNAYVSPELQSFVERRNVYASYYQHYSNVLAETATTFTDVNEFRDWFAKWREEVEAVRDFVQQDIFENECNKH